MVISLFLIETVQEEIILQTEVNLMTLLPKSPIMQTQTGESSEQCYTIITRWCFSYLNFVNNWGVKLFGQFSFFPSIQFIRLFSTLDHKIPRRSNVKNFHFMALLSCWTWPENLHEANTEIFNPSIGTMDFRTKKSRILTIQIYINI